MHIICNTSIYIYQLQRTRVLCIQCVHDRKSDLSFSVCKICWPTVIYSTWLYALYLTDMWQQFVKILGQYFFTTSQGGLVLCLLRFVDWWVQGCQPWSIYAPRVKEVKIYQYQKLGECKDLQYLWKVCHIVSFLTCL